MGSKTQSGLREMDMETSLESVLAKDKERR
jgi:hypothetical protein